MMNRRTVIASLSLLVVLAIATAAPARQTRPAATAPANDPTLAELTSLRDALKDAYNRGDVDRMLTYLHPDVVIIFPDGELLNGRDALRAYYDKKLKAPGHIVSKYTADPVVDGRHFRGDVDLSWGRMNDHYALTNGMEFGLNSRFSVTVMKSPDGPPETSGWMIRSFHSSTDAFDNPVLRTAVRRSITYGAIGGAVVGVIVGAVMMLLVARRRRAATAM